MEVAKATCHCEEQSDAAISWNRYGKYTLLERAFKLILLVI